MTTSPEPGTTPEQAVLEQAADVVDDIAERALEPAEAAAMDRLDHARRLLLVHAHPDDETINSGATMARYAAQGALVTLITCTRGELGEVIPDELKHLQGDPRALAAHRTGELAAAMEALGVADHRFLGADAGVCYQDSGMAWGPDGTAVAAPDTGVDAFARADVDEAAGHLARVIREVRPQVVCTYEPGGGYGHPDHVQTYRVTVRALELAATADGDGEPWQVAKLYWTVFPEDAVRELLRALAGGDHAGHLPDPDGPLPPMVVPDELVSTVIVADEQLPAKAAALRAHATQIVLHGDAFALSHGVRQPLLGTEFYRLALLDGRPAPPPVQPMSEQDLFVGL